MGHKKQFMQVRRSGPQSYSVMAQNSFKVNSYHFYFTLKNKILQLYCPSGYSPMENSGCFPRGKPAATESRYPSYGACLMFQCFHNSPKSDMDYEIFSVRTDVNACNCTRGCTDTLRESALKIGSGKKNPSPRQGIEPASAACRSDALPTKVHPRLQLFSVENRLFFTYLTDKCVPCIREPVQSVDNS